MIALEYKLKGKPAQYRVIDDMIRTAQFVRNKALRYWFDNQNVKLSDMLSFASMWSGQRNLFP